MLISTSRKPSQKTRTFCQTLSRVLDYEYLNRGKMSLRDLFLKSSQLGYDSTLLVYELKGNPSKMVFFDEDGEEILTLLINTAQPKIKLKTRSYDLSFQCYYDDLAILGDLFDLEDDDKDENYFLLEEASGNYVAVMELFDLEDNPTGFKILIRRYIFP